MAHLQDYEDAMTEKDKAFAALDCAEAKNAITAAWNWARDATGHAVAAGLCTWEEADDAEGNGRRPDTAALGKLFEKGATISGPVKIRNFTPHKLVIHNEDGTMVQIESEGQIRVTEQVTRTFAIETTGGKIVAVVNKEYGKVKLPDIADNEIIVVSKMVLDIVADHPRVFAPDTGPDSAVRSAEGQIVGIRRLQK